MLTIAMLLTQLLPVGLNMAIPQIEKLTFSIVFRYLVAGLSIIILYLSNLYKLITVNSKIDTSPLNRWGLILPMLSIGLLNLTGVDWSMVQPNILNIIEWLIDNLATGAFEELLMRGLVFLVLYRSWGHTRAGLYKVAIAQACLFGGLHLLNLTHASPIDVFAQIFYATIIGFGFAGLMFHTRSLSAVIIIHAFINACSSINAYFIQDYIPGVNDPSSYFVAIPLIFVLMGIPGIWALNRAPLMTKEAE
jgi:membrane protease YdiL (CAAX protease family)